MEITATELKNNLGKYLKMARTEDIVITKNGTPSVCLTAYTPKASEKTENADSLYDFSVPEPALLRESPLPAEIESYDTGEWLITHDGEPVASIVPARKKRRLGFITTGGPMSDEEVAALMEPVMTEEEIDEWLNKPL
ncbi:MAG: type II toxin-antitoxin system prevent-host-death family antitoxin [Clostridiales Family XIII bacterium]|jgi:prevent-host-death family protein|nr:type II toxin-antitoxin system prevent-host-death family antitoxin [Clostridiales Family XIII bacterium]